MTRPNTQSNVTILPPLPQGASSGMLDNIRWENYAQGLAAGKTQSKAYRDAGFTPNTKSAKKLAAHPVIAARVQSLREVALVSTGVTVQRIIDELAKLGFSNMLDYIRIDGEGQPMLDFSTLDRDKAAAVGEIVCDVITNPRSGEVTRRTKFKLHDKRTALVDMGKQLGMFKDQKEHTHKGVIFHVNPDDMQL